MISSQGPNGGRTLTFADRLISQIDRGLRTVQAVSPGERASPAAGYAETALADADRRHAARLMRVNHAGEVAAQALYQGQSLTTGDPEVQAAMEEAAGEEQDHLAWCEQRLRELDGSTSRLNPVWYAGSFAIGALAGLAGDRWSLGFVAETEQQVVEHLQGHIERLPAEDSRSRAILEQMREEESLHGKTALQAGGSRLPAPVRTVMRHVSRIMTRTAYWI